MTDYATSLGYRHTTEGVVCTGCRQSYWRERHSVPLNVLRAHRNRCPIDTKAGTPR